MGTCKNCGKPSGIFTLCFECNQEKSQGLIVKFEKWWEEIKTDQSNAESPCIVCGEKAPRGHLCYKCYIDKNNMVESLDNYETASDCKDHFYRLKNSIFSIKSLEYSKAACLRLIAIAEQHKKQFEKDDLIERVYNDVKKSLEEKKEYIESKKKSMESKIEGEQTRKEVDNSVPHLNITDEKDFRKAYDANIKCEDGHYVRSKSEKMIDDYLFRRNITHVYEKKVLDLETEESFLADFYLPTVGKGTFIEHFGMSGSKYLEKKRKKQEFYKRNNFYLIETTEKDMNTIDDVLDMQIQRARKQNQ